MSIQKMIHTYLDYIADTKQPSTIKRYRYDLVQFSEWLKNERKDQQTQKLPTQDEISSYYLYLMGVGTYSPNTIRRILSVLRFWLIYVGDEGGSLLIASLIKKTKLTYSSIPLPFLQERNQNRLFATIYSLKGLTENQKKYRPLMQVRNEVVFLLILHYGLSLQELTNLKINQVHFANNELDLTSRKGKRRVVHLSGDDRKKLFEYYTSIPDPIRPNRYDPMPFFIAFDYQKGTYRWDYEADAPKNWTEVSIQKMIRLEGKRAGFRNVTGSNLRKTYIISQLLKGKSKEELREELALKSTQLLEKIEKQYLESLLQNVKVEN